MLLQYPISSVITHPARFPMIRRLFPFSLVAFILCGSASAKADDKAIAELLKSKGATIVEKNGVVEQVTFKDSKALSEAEYKAIGHLRGLKNLTLYGSCHGLNDATLPLLSGLKALETLGTDGLKVTDEGLKHFTAFTSLKQASFFHTSFGLPGFTGVGFGHLKGCPKLERLTVAGISMGDAGFAAIATITQLKDFSTWHTYQTEAGNAEIAKLTNLVFLKLGQRLPGKGREATSLSDASLAKFAALKSLENFKIGEGRFTLDGLKALKQYPALKTLLLYETDFPETGLEALKKELPQVKITLEPQTEVQKKRLDQYVPL